MGLVEQVQIFGIHTYGPSISLIRLFSLIFNYVIFNYVTFLGKLN